MTEVQKITGIWLLLVIATVVAALIGDIQQAGLWGTLVALLLMVFKGQLVVDHFMGLRHVSPFWRWLMSAYCALIALIVFIVYYLSL